MKELISGFSNQLREAVKIAREATISIDSSAITHVVVSGMGGSGIGGKVASQLVENSMAVPLLVVNGYSLPAYVGPNTLLIVSSYSGNTEETLSALQEGLQKGAQIICVTTGGKVLEIAKSEGLSHIIIPGGNPPRAALGLSLVQQLAILSKAGLTRDLLDEVLSAADLLDREETDIVSKAQLFAKAMVGKMAVVYGDQKWESNIVRFRQQLNENSKTLASHQVFPELNHNEIVGWTIPPKNLALVLIRDEDDYDRNQQRINISKDIIGSKPDSVHEIWAKGSTRVEKSMYLVHLLDWATFYLCLENDQDPMAIEAIDRLKDELSKQQ